MTVSRPHDGALQLTVHLPSVPTAHIRVWMRYLNLDQGVVTSKWSDISTDASGVGMATFYFDRWMGGPESFAVETLADASLDIICTRNVNRDGTLTVPSP
jgi:hypothetical protein